MENEILDDDLLSFFADDSEGEDDPDSADELLDTLNTHTSSKEGEIKENSHNDVCGEEEMDNDTKRKIASLQAEINRLKNGSTSSTCTQASRSPPSTDQIKKTKSPVNEKNDICCKHGKPLDKCFFCTVTDTIITEKDTKPVKKANTISPKPKQCEKDSSTNSADDIFAVLPSIDGVNSLDLSKKRRLAHKSQGTEDYSKNPPKKSKIDKDMTMENPPRLAHKSKGTEDCSKNPPKKTKIYKDMTKENPRKIESSPLRKESGAVKADLFAGVEISIPILPSTVFDERIKGRKLIKISKIQSTMKGDDIEGDWVTVGVVVRKVTQKKSSTGKNFCVWQLSDLGLGTENKVVGFFLFGECYNKHWKIQVGRTIALLNPDIMKSDDKFSDQFSIKIDNPNKLMELGDAKYLGSCKGHRKSDGRSCTMFINKKYGEYCEYHVQAAFKKAKSSRMDLQSGGRAPPKGKILNNIRKDISAGEYYYGGQTVTLSEEKNSRKSAIKPKDDPLMKGLKSIMGHQIRMQAAIEFNEAKMKKEKESTTVKDTTAKSFLKSNRNELLKESLAENSIRSEKQVHHSITSLQKTHVQNEKKPLSKGNQKPKLCDMKFFDENVSTSEKTELKSGMQTLQNLKKADEKTIKSQQIKKKGNVPVLGRGLKTDALLEFSYEDDAFCYDKHTGEELLTSNPCVMKKTKTKDFKTNEENKHLPLRVNQAKSKAISIVRANGPIELENPNVDIPDAKKKTKKSLDHINKMIEGVDDSVDKEKSVKKKSLLAGVLGDINLNSEEGKKLLQQKSKHIGAVKLAEAEHEEKYFDALEKKENMQEKLSSIYEIKVNGIACRECHYLAESQSELCRELNHAVAKIPNMVKRFFVCKSCKQRCCSYNKLIPKKACTRCGENNYEKTSMVVQKQGPLLDSEKLEIRGTEKKFLFS